MAMRPWWRARARHYPPALAAAVLREALQFEGFGQAEDMLAARDDVVALYDLFGRVARQLLAALLALNQVYLPNPGFKSAPEIVGTLAIAPPNLLARLKTAYRSAPADGVAELHRLIADVFDLVDAHQPGIDTALYRERMQHRRGPWDALPEP
jgi:hypothetical protein